MSQFSYFSANTELWSGGTLYGYGYDISKITYTKEDNLKIEFDSSKAFEAKSLETSFGKKSDRMHYVAILESKFMLDTNSYFDGNSDFIGKSSPLVSLDKSYFRGWVGQRESGDDNWNTFCAKCGGDGVFSQLKCSISKSDSIYLTMSMYLRWSFNKPKTNGNNTSIDSGLKSVISSFVLSINDNDLKISDIKTNGTGGWVDGNVKSYEIKDNYY